MTVQTPGAWLTNAGATHTAAEMRRVLRFLARGAGGVRLATDLAVTATGTPDTNVHVAAGEALIAGTESAAAQGYYHEYNDADLAVDILVGHPADATNPRNDLIVFKVQDDEYSGGVHTPSIVQVVGTPNAVPVDPATPANAIVLARVRVDALATTIVAGKITDLRAVSNFALVGPISIPTTTGGSAAATSYGSMPVKLAENLLAAPTGAVTFNTIPGTFRHLELAFQARGDTAALTVEVFIRLNNDSTANYGTQRLSATNVTATAVDGTAAAQTGLRQHFIPAASAVANTAGHWRCFLHNYSGSVFAKPIHSSGGLWNNAGALGSAGELNLEQVTGLWFSVAPVTRIDLVTLSGNFVTGSLFTLYGIP